MPARIDLPEEELRELYAEYAAKEVGRRFGVGANCVLNNLRRYNIPFIYSWERGRPSNRKGKTMEEVYGKARADEIKKKQSLAHWLGGKSYEPYGVAFNAELKEAIRERDGHVCQECGWSEDRLDCRLSVHHIDYDKKNNEPSNLVSLCRSCHSQTNFSREDWTKYFQNKIGGN